MKVLHLQWERGTTNSIGDRKLVFSADKSIDLGDFNPFKIEQGTQFIVILIDANSKEAEEFVEETPEETKDRFRKRMNALINTAAEQRGQNPKEFREEYKKVLISKGIIKESTNELDLQGYARVIADLQQETHELEN